ncbi:hypothetical protein ACFVQB_15130 [Paenibacillus sp. NPDC057886]|uniref:hypothetical protein n=1 Tax=Paenibacillus sp. NPDC057886 TaxID=3346270 RepID=UPI0036B51FB7
MIANQIYTNNLQPLYYICNHHKENGIQTMTWKSFKKGASCPSCKMKKIASKLRKYKIEEIKELFDSDGATLLSTEFKSVDHHLDYVCSEGHLTKTILGNYLKGHGCWICGVEKRSRENHYLWEYGSSPIYLYLIGSVRQWVLDSLSKYDFKCAISRKTEDLHVHHANINFSTLAKRIVNKHNLSWKESIGNIDSLLLKDMGNELLEDHYKYGLGIPLHQKIHNEFHSRYGRTNNTIEQFKEFEEIYMVKQNKNKE